MVYQYWTNSNEAPEFRVTAVFEFAPISVAIFKFCTFNILSFDCQSHASPNVNYIIYMRMVQRVIGSIPRGGPTDQFLILDNAPLLV